jgi:uncharacterized protein (TIGR04255 family)
LTWRPINPYHAIERARFAIAFSEPVPEKLQKTILQEVDFRRDELGFGQPNPLRGTSIAFQIGPGGPASLQQAAPVTGWQFMRQTDPGLVQESLELNGAELSYQTTEYGRWALFMERLQSVLGDIPAKLGSVLSRRVTVLEYVDRFYFEGDPLESDATPMLGDLLSVLPTDVVAGESLWHIHRGWFENHRGKNVLVNINFGTEDGSVDGSKVVRGLHGLTRVELRHVDENSDVGDLTADLEMLHEVANATFKRSLTQEARELVGMGASP